jgi:D-alanyl-D-alanine carboxypeptidase (penicillin-binding protein 5/6)
MIITLILLILLLQFSGSGLNASNNQPKDPELGGGPIVEAIENEKTEDQEISITKEELLDSEPEYDFLNEGPRKKEDCAPEPEIPYSEIAIVIDSKNGKILYAKNEKKKVPIASLTKIMTAIVLNEEIEDWDDPVTISYNAAYSGGAGVDLREAEVIEAEKLFKAMLMNSDNAAAIALAEHVSGSTEEFAKLMNKKAKDLGAKETKFTEPSGLEDEIAYSTAYDIAIIAKYALEQNKIVKTMQISGPISVSSTNGLLTHRVGNTNLYIRPDIRPDFSHLIRRIVGAKTGFTYNAGYCLMTGLEDKTGDREAIGIILNGDKLARWNEMEIILEWSLDSYEW